ncbi:MAG TPA: hypothetical protein QF564_23325, partial [Pirellulaceae bacterium]|nr:hypothetical protein [Pirellulaceae bacterium]
LHSSLASDWPPSFGFGGYSKTSLLPKSPNRREATFLPRQQKSESLQREKDMFQALPNLQSEKVSKEESTKEEDSSEEIITIS